MKPSASTVKPEFVTSISTTEFLTGTISFEFGTVVNSITVEAAALILDIDEIFNELIVIWPVV